MKTRRNARMQKLVLLALLCLVVLPLVAGRQRANPGISYGQSNPCVGVVPATPEPGAFAVFALGAGLAGLAIRRQRRH